MQIGIAYSSEGSDTRACYQDSRVAKSRRTNRTRGKDGWSSCTRRSGR